MLSSLQQLDVRNSNITDNERKDIVQSALECGEYLLKTLDEISTIAKNKLLMPFYILHG